MPSPLTAPFERLTVPIGGLAGGAIMTVMADRGAGSGITRKEAEVLAGLGEQLSNAEIATRMFVSVRTVETHVSSLLRKLHASNRRELGRLAGWAGDRWSMVGSARIGPSGTVTFLFTDIEDSTAWWERQPSAMPDVLDRLCTPLGVAEDAHTARCELASHYTQLGQPREALALIRTTIPDHIRVGAWHEVYAALAHTAQALADLGRPRVAATILGRLGTGTSELNQTFFGFPELHDELVADLGAAELATLIAESRSRTLTDLAQLVIQTIDELR